MVRLNVFILIPDSSRRAEIMDTAVLLVEKSLHDKGCIAYDVFSSITRDNVVMICETWENEEFLKKHQETEHFRTLVPKLQELGTLTLEKFDF